MAFSYIGKHLIFTAATNGQTDAGFVRLGKSIAVLG
jgi:hypothetical protein